MPIIARFSLDVPFGKKQELFRIMTKWQALEQDLGFPAAETLIGSVGAPESRIEMNYRFDSLAALEGVFAKVAKEPRLAEYQQDLAGFVVPGSHRWEIFRVQET